MPPATSSPTRSLHDGRLSSAEDDSHTDPTLLAALADPATYGVEEPVTMHETHASWVFLAGEFAYKVKKPVRLAFLDHGTLARRRAACREEVRVNGDLAPGIYVGVWAILRTAEGYRLSEDTHGAVEYVVVMRRFDETHTLLGAVRDRSLTREQIGAVAQRLAGFHLGCPAPPAGGAVARDLDTWVANIEEIEQVEHPSKWQLGVMRAFGEAFVRAHTREITQRAADGWVRDGHGDLRCEHVLLGSPIRVVDRIEFDPVLRHLDVGCDLAFLTMDLEAHGRRWAARELLAGYREAGGNPGSEQLHAFHGAYWAQVRAKVALIAAASRSGRPRGRELARAQRLWKLAERLCWRARRPVAVVVCGAAASGKSTLVAELERRSQLPVLSSDAIRKRRAGLRITDRAPTSYYTETFTLATYALLGSGALERLGRRGGVIVDATCHTKSERASLFQRLRKTDATFLFVHCKVSLQTALARATTRMQSPQRVSDATPRIVARQFHRFQPLDELPAQCVLTLDGEESVDVQVAQVTRAIDERLSAQLGETRAWPTDQPHPLPSGAPIPCHRQTYT